MSATETTGKHTATTRFPDAVEPLFNTGDEAVGNNHYLRLRADILSGQFAVGTQLLETSLSSHYGVSRTPIREALTALEHDGLIERAPRGYRVRTGTPDDVLEIYEARIALEAAAAEAAAQRRSDLELARLDHLHRLSLEAHDRTEAHEANAAWHGALWAASHNVTICSTLNRWMAQLRIYDQGPPGPTDDRTITQKEHTSILEAIRSRDAQAAGQIMAEHLTRTRDLRLTMLASE
jgi:DNA-binding GntR family transcriptional regulator